MRILLTILFALTIITGFSQSNRYRTIVPLLESGTPSTEIASVSYDFDKIYYYETETIDLVATPNIGVLSSSWSVRDMETNELVGLSYGNTANISTVSEIGWYKISYDAVTTTDRIHQEWDDILILDRRFTREEADVIADMASGNYYNDFAEADNTGLKIWVENNGTGYCYLGNLWGSAGFDNYVRIQAEDDGFVQTGIGGSTGLGLSGGRYIIVDGHKADKTQGWEIQMPTGGTFDVRLSPEDAFTNIIFTGIKTNRQGYTDAAAFSLIAGYSQTWNSVTWVVEGMAVHDCWIENAGAEGAYWGFTDDRIFSGSPDFQPVKFRGFIFAWNTIINSGNDGIQPCNSINQRIHDNYVNGVGLETNQFHETGTSYNAGNSGNYYNNFIKNAKMFMTMDTGLCPGCDLYAGDSTLRPSNFYNNVFVTGTYPGGGVTESGAIYIQYRAGYMGTGELDWNFWNNTFVTSASKELMNIYFSTGGLTNPDFLMVNNIVVSNPTGGDYNEVDFIGPGTQPTSEVINNLYYDNGNEAPILFTDTTNLNYRPSSLSSTAFTGSPEDVGAIVGTPLRDADGFIITYNYYGAYSRSDLSTIDPTPADGDPAAFDTALSVENVTDIGGDIEFEADKEGLLFWSIVANDATAPTVPQLIAGGFGITSGSVMGALAPSSGSFTGLTESTAYDLYGVFVTADYIPQASATKVDFTTAADVVAPTLSGWEITDANPNRLYFNSSEVITATTYTGFSIDRIIGTVTITGVTINSGQTTGHYFTLSENVESIDYLARIAYAGGSDFEDLAENALASISVTSITNSVDYAYRMKINISNAANYVGTSDWNDVALANNVGVKTLIANVNDDTGTPTGFVYAITNAFHDYHNTANATAGIYINNANAIVRGIEVYNGGDNSGTLRLSGLTPGKNFHMIYLIKNTFGTGAGNVNVNAAGAVGYTTGTVERKVSGVVDGSGFIDWVITQTASNSSEVLVALIIDIEP